MNIASESAPKGTTHFLRYASGYIVWCKIDEGQNNQLVLSEWDSGNEYWVPGIHSVDFYQSIGLHSVDDFTVTMPEIDMSSAPRVPPTAKNSAAVSSGTARVPAASTSGRTAAGVSAYKSAADLAKVCWPGSITKIAPAIGGFEEIETQQATLPRSNEQRADEDDLTWLARNMHKWPHDEIRPASVFTFPDGRRSLSTSAVATALDHETRIFYGQWLARRAELQNKPEEWPSNANWLAQDAGGGWSFYTDHADNPPQCHGESAWYSDDEEIITKNSGEVLGDWRDTLVHRPEYTRADVEVELVKAIFEPFTSIEDNQEKKMQQDNGWFERGELPPVGATCQMKHKQATSEWARHGFDNVFIVAGGNELFISADQEGGKELIGFWDDYEFRPIRTEVDHLKDLLIQAGVTTSIDEAAAAILSAGFKRDGGAA